MEGIRRFVEGWSGCGSDPDPIGIRKPTKLQAPDYICPDCFSIEYFMHPTVTDDTMLRIHRHLRVKDQTQFPQLKVSKQREVLEKLRVAGDIKMGKTILKRASSSSMTAIYTDIAVFL
jgi:hypothetical protein